MYVVGGNSVSQVENDIAALGLITDHADAARALAGPISDVQSDACHAGRWPAQPPAKDVRRRRA